MRETSLGADTGVYISALHHYLSLPKESVLSASLVYPYDFEPAYFFLTKISAFLGLSDMLFLMVIAIFIYVPIFTLIYRYSENIFLSVLVYFGLSLFGYSLGIFRQMIALSICLCSIPALLDRRILSFFGTVILATLFHVSAIVFVVLWFYKKINLYKFLLITIIVSIALLVFGRHLVLFIVRVFPMYSGYIGSKYDTQGGTYIAFIILLVITAITINFLNLRKRYTTFMPEIIRLSVFALAVSLCVQAVSYSMGIMGRSVGYFTIFQLVLVPYLVSHAFGKHGSVLALYGFVPVYVLLAYQSLLDLPFSFFWQ